MKKIMTNVADSNIPQTVSTIVPRARVRVRFASMTASISGMEMLSGSGGEGSIGGETRIIPRTPWDK